MVTNKLDFTVSSIRESIINYKNDSSSQKLEILYYSKSFSEILGVSRRELSHSNFIAWLLDNGESHQLGEFSVKKFFDIVLLYSNDNQKNKHKQLYNAFATEDYHIESLSVQPEYIINGVGRIDIYIDLIISFTEQRKNIIVIIENKVTSKEHSDQTNKYYNFFSKKENKNTIFIYIYLTTIPTLKLINLSEPECNCKHFIQINYQSLVDYLIEPSLNQNISTRSKSIITEYLKSLSQPAINLEEQRLKPELIMALGSEERELLASFWDKNKKLILAALYAISSDPEQDEDTRESITEALNNLSTSKDYSTVTLSYDGTVFVESIKKSDIGVQTIKLLLEKELINDDNFNFIKTDKSSSFLLLKKQEEITENEKKYRKYKFEDDPELIFNNEEYYVARNWGIGNINKFINKFSEKFPKLKYQVINKTPDA